MKSQNQQFNSSDDFSIITPDQRHMPLDFSLQSLLSEHPPQQPPENFDKKEHQDEMVGGSFVKDLEKLEKEISYESDPYNIYETSDCLIQLKGTIESKQESTCTKTFQNNLSKSIRFFERRPDQDCKDLIIDFDRTKKTDKIQPEKLQTERSSKDNDKNQENPTFSNHFLQKHSCILPSPKSSLITKSVNLKKSKSKSMVKSQSKSKKKIPTLSKSKSGLKKIKVRLQSGQKQEKTRQNKKKQKEETIRKSKNEHRLKNEVMEEYFGFTTYDSTNYEPKKEKMSKTKKKKSKSKNKKSLSKKKSKKTIPIF